MVRYNNGEDLNFDEVIERLDSCNPIITGDICEYDFDDYEIIVKEGESIAITTLSDTFDGIKYQVFNTEIYIREDDLFPITYTKAIRPMDLGERLVSIITGNEDSFDSSIFKEGGKYENYLLAHGTWLRNMPEVLNQGQDSEKRVQASISLETMYEAYGINEPLRYDTNQVGLGEVFEIGTEKETQQNFVSIRIGETRDKFRLNQVKPIRKVIGDNYYSSIHIGSTKSGNDYGEVNNLYSICGNANFTTINALNDSEYKATTEVRTGAEDVEFTRSVQYEDFPDKDTERDDDWFLLHCTKVGDEYFLVKWPALYSEKPNNVYSASTNYNYAFSPARLLLGHGWKLNSGLMPNIKDKISFSKSNCNGSLVTKKAGEEELYEDGGKSIEQDKRIEHKWLENPTVISKTVEFSHPVTQEIWDMLNGTTNGVDNKYGLVEYLTRDGVQYGRLIKVDRSGEGKWTLIEAKLN